MKHSMLLIAVATLIPMGAAVAQSAPTPGQNAPAPGQNAPAPAQSAPMPGQNAPTPAQNVPTPGQNAPAPSSPAQPAPGQAPQGTSRTGGSPVRSNNTTLRGTFQSIDEDGDGRISRTEASGDKQLDRGFMSADSNRDGFVDNDEYVRSRSNSSASPQSPPPQ